MDSALISVVICTYNRHELLAQVIKSLVHQTIPSKLYEIIVIDNNSTDITKDVTNSFIHNYPQIAIRYVFEANQGLSHARNRGWREAKGNYIAYLDDDCKAPQGWLITATEVIKKIKPGVFGGPYNPYYIKPKPKWFKDDYGSYSLGSEQHFMSANEFLNGGNIFFRRTLLEEIGGFNPKLGMNKDKLAYGEETALQIAIRDSMPNEPIFYCPDLLVYHLVRPEKTTIPWRFQQKFAEGRASYSVFNKGYRKKRHLIVKILMPVYWVLKLGSDIVRIPIRKRFKFPFVQNYLYETIADDMYLLGQIFESIDQNIGQSRSVLSHLKSLYKIKISKYLDW